MKRNNLDDRKHCYNLSINIIIKEYLDASNLFLNDSQTKYLNALLDNTAKKLRSSNA